MIEDHIVAHSKDLIRAFAVMVSAYYVFNVEYPNSLVGTLTYIQKFMLKIGDNTKTLQRVLSLVSRLKKACPGV